MHRLPGIGIVTHRETVSAKRLFFRKAAVQIQRSIFHMNAVFLNRHGFHTAFHPKNIQQPGYLLGKPGSDKRFHLLIDLLFQQGFIRYDTIFCKEAAAQTYHGVRLQKLLAEQDFIQLIAEKPCMLFIVLDFDSPPFFCFSRTVDALPRRHDPAYSGFPGNAVRSLYCPGCPCAGL